MRMPAHAYIHNSCSDAEGVSALHHAIDHDCAPIVSLLLDYVRSTIILDCDPHA